MFILKKGYQPGVYVPLRALFLVTNANLTYWQEQTFKSSPDYQQLLKKK